MASVTSTYSSTSSSSTRMNITKSRVSEGFNQFLVVVDNYRPTIPEAVVKYYMEKSGAVIQDSRVLKLVSLAADKFLAETINEAKEQATLKAKNPKNKRKTNVVPDTIDIYDLEGSLSQRNIFWRRSLRRKPNSDTV